MRHLCVVLLVAFACSQAVHAQTFEQFTEGFQLISTGMCRMKHKTFMCARIQKAEKNYLVIFNDENKPHVILREEDMVVVWVAGVHV